MAGPVISRAPHLAAKTMSHADILPVSPRGRRYGLVWENPFHPARSIHTLKLPAGLVIPPAASCVQSMGPIRNQGDEGSCAGQAGAEKYDALYRGYFGQVENRTIQPNEFMASASFVYKNCLIADGDLGTDAGTTIHQVMVQLNARGVCLNSQEPYSDNDYSVPPTAQEYTDALQYPGGAYHFLPGLQEMKACIASNYTFIFGITVYESFERNWGIPGFMPMPDTTTEQVLGGHAQHVLAYDDNQAFPSGAKGGLFVQNSWGGWDVWPSGISAPSRTDAGCYWMPYEFVSAGLTNDAWIMHFGLPWGRT